MVSLEDYLDSQAAQVAEDVIKIYKAETADRDLSEDFRAEKEAYDLKRLTEIRLKQGEDAAFEEYERLKREEEAKAESSPTFYYLAYNAKDVTVRIMRELGKWPRALIEAIADYCASEGKKPSILDQFNDKSLLHHFDLLVEKYEEPDFIILKVKEAEQNIRELARTLYFDILILLKEGKIKTLERLGLEDIEDDEKGTLLAIEWGFYVSTCGLRVHDEFMKIDLAFLFKEDLYSEARKLLFLKEDRL